MPRDTNVMMLHCTVLCLLTFASAADDFALATEVQNCNASTGCEGSPLHLLQTKMTSVRAGSKGTSTSHPESDLPWNVDEVDSQNEDVDEGEANDDDDTDAAMDLMQAAGGVALDSVTNQAPTFHFPGHVGGPGPVIPVFHSQPYEINFIKKPLGNVVIATALTPIFRPLYQKTLRCSDNRQESCTECVGTNDCFGDVAIPTSHGQIVAGQQNYDYARVVRGLQSSKWTRFLTVIHVECPKATQMRLGLKKLERGTVKVFWDGTLLKSVTQQEVMSVASPRTFQTRVPVDPGNLPGVHGHNLVLEFSRDMSKRHMKAVAWVGTLSLIAPQEFTQCMDKKMCMNDLANSGRKGKILRTSNRLLTQCLQRDFGKVQRIPKLGKLCKTFRKCLRGLKGGNHEEELLLILKATQVSGKFLFETGTSQATHLIQGSSPTQVTSTDDEEICIFPPTEDPMSWDCDCWEAMHTLCHDIGIYNGKQLQMCLTAQYCMHPKICRHWHADQCTNNPAIESLQVKLKKAKEKALLEDEKGTFNSSETAEMIEDEKGAFNSSEMAQMLERRRSTGDLFAQTMDLDRSAKRKQCN
eukprot:gnl/TRDRNA2_/TRDRNA2_85405_c1_seq1.p1 gnl/TRDRNA2_/TRDRNA2_85405_c1~~gnl/TRDRNA2_/TRDRNA2_85405_c1_seq1.p1  ORF type:complete len:589 (-),score=78.19 gnl/TRDRNA2_/TRDRNA2_85405_c1_seq1:90-1835(-)